jgi:hypothetical protein
MRATATVAAAVLALAGAAVSRGSTTADFATSHRRISVQRPRDPFVRAPPHRLLVDGSCNLTGTWVDDGGNVASIVQGPDYSLVATSITTGTGWTTADGALVGPLYTSLWMDFQNGGNLTADVLAACSTLSFSNGQKWTLTAPTDSIKTVHVVAMIHLDIGFTNLAHNVCELYFQHHFPAGIATSQALRAANPDGTGPQYAITSHPWLIQEFLDGKVGCSLTPRNDSMLALMEDAIANDFVRWHAKPAQMFLELEDASHLASSLLLATNLGARYNKSWGSVTGKITDVTGMSRSAIPILAAAGKQAMHIGYNSACRVPNIPMAFQWSHAETGTSLLTFVNNNYGSVITVPGSEHALVFLYTPDNSSPPAPADVVSFFASTQQRFPNATVSLSSLDAFALAIAPIAETLPQVTGEIGQSWSYGAPADHLKLAGYRTIRRLRNQAVVDGWLDPLDPDLLAYERRLLLAGPEHNFGLCFACIIPSARTPEGNWSNELFHALRYTAPYALMTSSNQEKSDFLIPNPPPANASAGYTRFLDAAYVEGQALFPTTPDTTGYAPIDPSKGPVTGCGRFSSVSLSPSDGSIVSLIDGQTGFEWVAGGGGSLGAFSYKTYTEWDFQRWNLEYNPSCGPPCGDFAKWGLDTANPINATWLPNLTALWQRQPSPNVAECSFLAELALDPTTVSFYGGMQQIYLNITLDPNPLSPIPTVSIQLMWMNKTATRLAESSWLSFQPSLGPAGNVSLWAMDVLGSPVSPLEVVDMGTRHTHAVWDGVRYDARPSGGPFIRLQTLDAFLVAPGDTDHLLWYDGLAQPDLTGGWHFNLHNNVWGTAFRQWSDEDGLFRFVLELQAPKA